jgi:hypothetical protein
MANNFQVYAISVNSVTKRSHEAMRWECYKNDKIIQPQTLKKYTKFVNNF